MLPTTMPFDHFILFVLKQWVKDKQDQILVFFLVKNDRFWDYVVQKWVYINYIELST